MSAEYMHVGIPVVNKKPGMVYNDWGGFWVNESVDEYDSEIARLKFEEARAFLRSWPSSRMWPIRSTTWIPTSPTPTA